MKNPQKVQKPQWSAGYAYFAYFAYTLRGKIKVYRGEYRKPAKAA
jgi:hypothetical protein